MRPITTFLIALFFALIIGRIIWKRSRHRILTGSVQPDRLIMSEDGLSYDEYIKLSKEHSGNSDEEAMQYFQDLLEQGVDTEAPDQAILYDETNNLFLVSAAILARMNAGDERLINEVRKLMEQHPDSSVLVGDFGIKRIAVE